MTSHFVHVCMNAHHFEVREFPDDLPSIFDRLPDAERYALRHGGLVYAVNDRVGETFLFAV